MQFSKEKQCLLAGKWFSGKLYEWNDQRENEVFELSIRCYVKVTVQPFISSIHKPASKLSVAAMQLLFIYAKAKWGWTNKFVPSERAREGFALISEMKGYSTIKMYLTIQWTSSLYCQLHFYGWTVTEIIKLKKINV